MSRQTIKHQNTVNADNIPDTITQTVRKSQLNASNGFEFKKLGREQDGLLKCTIEEDGESLVIHYNIHNLTEWDGIRKEKRDLIVATLLDVGRLQDLAQFYTFDLSPTNLYYDIQGRVYIKARDVYAEGKEYSNEEFLKQYKSLIGCTLTKKYKFEDYYNGGQDLLKEDKLLSEIMSCTELEQLKCILKQEYLRYREEHNEKFVEISRWKNQSRKTALSIVAVLLLASASLIGYFALWERPYKQAVIEANEAYLHSNYSATIDAMESVKVERMNVNQKYILAVSCVKCESLNDENMRNILNTITLNGDEKLMEYWIYINRLDTDKAADIAMQESSNQLLYYAYLKEKAVIENDSSLTGKEKSSRLSEIESKLEPLASEYSTIIEE